MKKLFSAVMSLLVVIAACPIIMIGAAAEEPTKYEAGDCVVTVNGTVLTVSSMRDKGEMPDYKSFTESPWSKEAGRITEVVIENTVINIGDYAFAGFGNLESVKMADSVEKI